MGVEGENEEEEEEEDTEEDEEDEYIGLEEGLICTHIVGLPTGLGL